MPPRWVWNMGLILLWGTFWHLVSVKLKLEILEKVETENSLAKGCGMVGATPTGHVSPKKKYFELHFLIRKSWKIYYDMFFKINVFILYVKNNLKGYTWFNNAWQGR